MKDSVFLGVWAYTVAALLAEVASFYYFVANTTVLTILVSTLAATQAVAIVLFYMHLKDEPGAVKLFAVIPIMFLAGLLIAMVASLG